MRLLVIAGAVAVVVGGVAIWLGVPVKEFSFGNTMILAGAMAICSGLVLIGLGMVVRELRSIRRSLQEVAPSADRRETEGPPLPAGSIAGWSGRTERDAFEARPVIPEGRSASESLAPSGLRGETVGSHDGRDGSGSDIASAGIESGKFTAEVAPPVPSPVKGRRDLLFSSSRREREKARGAAVEPPSAAAPAEPAAGSAAGRRAEPHPSFNRAPSFGQDSGPVEQAADADLTPSRRAGMRSPPAPAAPPPVPEAPAVTVVKSGAVDGMAYSLYSDGSIEAQMPEGMMRFASIERLRAYLDRDR